MRIAFVGLPLAALLLQADGHTIVWAGICRRHAIGTRRLTRIIGEENVVVVPDLAQPVLAKAIKETKPDLLVSWFWTKNIPPIIRAIAPLGSIGVHPSLLPRHRGPDPTFWAIDSGDHETGVTVHWLENEYDTGAILAQQSIVIDDAWNAWTLAKKLDRPSLSLLREVVQAYSRGQPPKPREQDEADATEAPEPDDDLLELRFAQDSAEQIVRRIRAASPWPGAFTSIGGELVTIVRARVAPEVPRALDPGEAFVRPDGVAVVRAAGAGGVDVGVELLEGRVGEDDTEIDAKGIAAIVRAGTH